VHALEERFRWHPAPATLDALEKPLLDVTPR
jgi:hypothetical protein